MMAKRDPRINNEPVKLQKKYAPALGPIQVEPRPAFLLERPDWPSRREHERERQQILDRGEVLLTAEEVAKRYGRTVQWVYACKRLHVYRRKAGKYVVYRLSDLLEFEENKVGAGRGYAVDVIRQDEQPEPDRLPVKGLKLDIL